MAESVKKLLYFERLLGGGLFGTIRRQSELGELDLGTQRDFREDAVKAWIPTALPKCAGCDLEAC
jgi:hypothetical protein